MGVLSSCLDVYVGTTDMPGACRGQKRGPMDPQELQSQRVMSSHTGAGNQTRVLRKSRQFSLTVDLSPQAPLLHC